MNKFKVGQFWKTRAGYKAEIVEIDYKDQPRIKLLKPHSYHCDIVVNYPDGTWHNIKDMEHVTDLISLWEEDMKIEAGKSYKLNNNHKFTCLKITNIGKAIGFAVGPTGCEYSLNIDLDVPIRRGDYNVVSEWKDKVKIEHSVYMNVYKNSKGTITKYGPYNSVEHADENHSLQIGETYLGKLELTGSKEYEV
jgi:hypothetical protein